MNKWMDDLDPYLKARDKVCVNNPKALALIDTRMFARVVPNS